MSEIYKGFSKKVIGEQLNNLVVITRQPNSLKAEIQENRLKGLRNYMQAIVGPLVSHIEEGLIKPEEMVFILTSASLWFHLVHVLKTDKLPLGPSVKKMFETKINKELPEIDVKCPFCKKTFSV